MLKPDDIKANNIVRQIISIGESTGTTNVERLEFYLAIMEQLEVNVRAIHSYV